jgi:hypothetical protein
MKGAFHLIRTCCIPAQVGGIQVDYFVAGTACSALREQRTVGVICWIETVSKFSLNGLMFTLAT